MTETDPWPIRCTAEITRDDYGVLLQSRGRLATRAQNLRSVAGLVVLAIGLTWLIWSMTSAPIWQAGAFVGVLVVAYALLMARFAGRLNARLYYNTFRVDKSPNHYTVSVDGLVVENATSSGSFKWQAFHAIMRTKTHFLFWVTPMNAYLIPFRVLSEDAIERLWSVVKHLPNACEDEVRL